MRLLRYLAITAVMAASSNALTARVQAPASLRFEIRAASGLGPRQGRVFVALNRRPNPEPRFTIGNTGVQSPPFFAADASLDDPGGVARIDRTSASFPIASLGELPAGEYYLQAVLDSNNDHRSVNAPGNLYSKVQKLHLAPDLKQPVRIELTEQVQPEELPAETGYLKFERIRSALLSRFHGRPIYLRAGIILPKDYAVEPSRRFPLRVHIGGYGARFTQVRHQMVEGSSFRRTWLADDTPRMIFVHLDGDGPYGDPYQVNSENNGPYGDAVTRELIPHIEQKYRAIGRPHARVLDGGSTGGWVSLALQVFYPDFFNGAWSFCPDSVDFRSFQLINIYEDKNAYVNRNGFERPSAREISGDVRFSMRHELQMENAMGRLDSWTLSGGQWGAWNAAYSPRTADGRPASLWDPRSGVIDSKMAEAWKRYDLRLVLENGWQALAPRLRGKIRIWVGEADHYFLNNAVHRLDDFLSKSDPPFDARIVYGSGKGHCWVPLSEGEILREMAEAVDQGAPRGAKY